MLLRQVGKQHLAHQRRALSFPDHQDYIDATSPIYALIHQLEMKFVCDRQAKQVGNCSAVKSRQQGDSHEGAQFRRIGHVGEHLNHSDQGPDHAESRRAISYCAINLLPFVQMRQKIVSVAFEIVPNEISVVAIRDETNALGKKRVLYFDLFKSDGSLLPRNLCQASQFVDQVALTHSAKRKGKFGAKRQAVENRRKWKSYKCGGEGAAKNHDCRVDIEKHPQIAAHEYERAEDDSPRQQA